jgi:glycosyltransferase involved in cell wall biosynthesis
VEAIKILKGKFRFEVLMIGDGPERETIEAKIMEYGLNGIIQIRPFVNQEELWLILRDADLLCHPCDYEGLSKIVVESMTIGLPVLVSDVVPLNEYIEDNHTGYLVSNTPFEWAKKIENIFSDYETYSCVAREARKFALDFFDPDKNVKIYEEQFSRILIQH